MQSSSGTGIVMKSLYACTATCLTLNVAWTQNSNPSSKQLMLACSVMNAWLLCLFCFMSWQHFKVISGQVPILYCALLATFKWCPARIPGHQHHDPISPQSYNPDTLLTNPFPNLLMPSVRLGSNKCQCYKSFSWLSAEEVCLLSIRSACPVHVWVWRDNSVG